MIRLTDRLPFLEEDSAEWVRICCTLEAYRADNRVMFWIQDGGRAVLCLADGNMTVFNRGADCTELAEFIGVIAPRTVFSDSATLKDLGLAPEEELWVMSNSQTAVGTTPGDTVDSRGLYDLLNTDGLTLPPYPDFAVDYCRRINRGLADCFVQKDRCAAFCFLNGNKALLCGLASRKKGCGSLALRAIRQQNPGKTFLAVCRTNLKEFYIRNGFQPLYTCGCWGKNDE